MGGRSVRRTSSAAVHGAPITIPLLTFVATLAACWRADGHLDDPGPGPTFFLQRIVDNVGATLLLALIKAPFMAGVVASIGCRQGMLVGGDVQSLGQRVTAAVVHAIFSVIMLDAVFALIYMQLDL